MTNTPPADLQVVTSRNVLAGYTIRQIIKLDGTMHQICCNVEGGFETCFLENGAIIPGQVAFELFAGGVPRQYEAVQVVQGMDGVAKNIICPATQRVHPGEIKRGNGIETVRFLQDGCLDMLPLGQPVTVNGLTYTPEVGMFSRDLRTGHIISAKTGGRLTRELDEAELDALRQSVAANDLPGASPIAPVHCLALENLRPFCAGGNVSPSTREVGTPNDGLGHEIRLEAFVSFGDKTRFPGAFHVQEFKIAGPRP